MSENIPKIIHYCWFGGKPLPKKTKEFIKTWSKKNPDYEIRRWDESNFDYAKYPYANEAYEHKKWAFVSDVCRLEKLHQFGGIYIDVNTEVLKSFDDLLENEMVLGFEQDNMIMGAPIMVKKNHPLIKKILTDYYEKERLVKDNGKINFRTINSRMQAELLELGMLPDNSNQTVSGINIFSKEYFCPTYWDTSQIDPITSDTYLIHYFGGSWHDEHTKRLQELQRGELNVLVSVVVPVYNVEKYLKECVESITDQTYKNLEIILVDDKTPDRSGEIAQECAKNDRRIKVIHKSENEGLNMARATGFEACTGEYVVFVDSDDLLATDFIETALRELYENAVDFVKFNHGTFKDSKTLDTLKGGILQTTEPIKKSVIKGKRDLYKTRFSNDIVGLSVVCVWGGLYPSSAIRKMNWKESNYRINEDNFWTLQLFEYVDSGVYTSKVGYLYRSDENYTGVLSKSLTGNQFNGIPVGYLEFVEKYFKVFRRYNKKYGLDLNNDIDLLESWTWIHRLINLSDNDLLGAENNAKYVPIALKYMVNQYKGKSDLNTVRKTELKKLKGENETLRSEIKSFLSVKRSARLLIGNIRRKFQL